MESARGGQGHDVPLLLFVCTGNVCRSPFAERYAVSAQRSLAMPWRFASVGIGALVGAPMDEHMAAELRARGADSSGFAAQQLSLQLARQATLLVTMDVHQREVVMDDFPAAAVKTFTLAQLLDTLPSVVGGQAPVDVVRGLRRHRAASDPADDIPDPYQQGSDAARLCAERLVTALDVVLPRLA